jgi:pSer/pThr/pTyr-binding forkhead associated (FHA) protein
MKLIYDEDGVRKTYELPEGKLIEVGREAGSGLQIAHRSVSKKHCELLLQKGSLTLKDLGSSNGTFINGERITQGTAGFGDSIRIGHVNVTLEDESLEVAISGSEVNSGGTMIDENFGEAVEAPPLPNAATPAQFGSFGSAPSAPSAPSASPELSNLSEDKLCKIKVIAGAPAQIIPLRSAVTTLGTDRDCTIVLDSPGISAKHAEIVQENGKFTLRDLNSKNGIFVNREKVFEKVLAHGDNLQICSVRLAFDASATGAKNKRLLFIVSGVFLALMLFIGIIKIATATPQGGVVNAVDNNAEEKLKKYKDLVNQGIDQIRSRNFKEALSMFDAAKLSTPPDNSGAIANLFKKINKNLWKESEIDYAVLEELQQDFEKVISTLKDSKWEQPKAFATEKLAWTKNQLKYSDMIGDAKLMHSQKQYLEAIQMLRKVPPKSILFNAELENKLLLWEEEHENRLIAGAQKFIDERKFREAIPLLETAQTVRSKYNEGVAQLQELCKDNLTDSNLFEEAKSLAEKGRNRDAINRLATIKKSSLVYEESKKLKQQIFTIELKSEILESYQTGNGDEALRLLAETDSDEMRRLEKKIRGVLESYEKLDNQRSLATPDRQLIREAAQAIIILEEDEENHYNKEAKEALEEFGDVKGVANRYIGEARKSLTKKDYASAKAALDKVIGLSELEENSAEKQEALKIIKDISFDISREYLHIVNHRTLTVKEKIGALENLLKAISKTDRSARSIENHIKKFKEEIQDE